MPDENIETVFKIVQKFIETPPLIVWGSGATISFGLPSMWDLNEALKKEIKDFDIKNENLEIELGKEKYQEKMPQIKKIIWDTIHKIDIQVLEKVLLGNPEFNGVEVLIKKLIDTHPKVVNIITTNYDRVLEYVLSYNNIPFTDGFNGKILSIFDNTLFKDRDMVNLIKVHGSLNWFNVNDDIRYINCYSDKYEPQIITPSKDKYREAHRSPYRELIRKSDSLIETASSFLVVGFGFNDEHLTPKIREKVKEGIPTVLITKEVTENTKEELKDANKYIFLEDSSKENKTKITYKTSKDSTEISLEIDGSYWQLNKFMEILQL